MCINILKKLPRAPATESNRLHRRYDDLEEENEEVDHEVEGGVTPEGLVYRPVPADEAEGSQQHEVENGQAEYRETLAGDHQRHRADYVQSQH